MSGRPTSRMRNGDREVTITRIIQGAVLAVALLASVPAIPASAGESDEDAFSVLREQTVSTVGKRPLPLSETPSSVTIVSAAEIRAMGYQTVGDALRWVRGVFVTYDRTYTNVGVRGLQRPGDFNNKVLLTIDGHTMNGSVYGDALLGPELGLDLEEVERIEIARGPGSALYGSYAVLAVVNVVTRQPRSEPGAHVDLRWGGADERRGHASIASARPGLPEWRASVSWLQARGRELAMPASLDPLLYPGLAVARDRERALAFFGDADWGPARLVVKLNQREKAQLPASYTMPVNDNSSPAWDGHDFVELSATQRATPALELSGRTYWDGSRTRARFVSIDEPGAEPLVNLDFGNADVLGAEGRANWSVVTGQALTLGLEAQRMVGGQLLNYDVAPYEKYYDRRLTGGMFALYLQDEARIGGRLILTAGARLDRDSRYRTVVSPRADLVWTIAPDTRLKLLGGSAFRAPSMWESESYAMDPPPGGGRLDAERVVTIEGTLEHEIGSCRTFLTAYGSRIRDLIDLVEVDPSGRSNYLNHQRVRCRGLETGVRFTPGARTHARVALAWQQSNDGDTGAEISNSPRWNGHVLAFHTWPDGRTTLGAGLRCLSSRLASDDVRTGAAAVCDARLARRFPPGLTVGIEARNLFDSRYSDTGWVESPQDLILQDPRSLFVTVSFRTSEPG
jgi:outer membrane receptor protein involved in Fe transport